MKGKSKGSGVIGDNYLEVSLDEQHLYYYENGALVLDSDVVTGNHAYGYDTPQGVYSVYFMQRNRTLVGETYRSFVNYWIAFYNHYGVHDASWRNEFGGDIYLPVYQIVFKKRSYLFVRDILSVAQGATIKKYSIVIWRNAAKLCICPESLRLVGKEMRLLNDFDYSAGAFSG